MLVQLLEPMSPPDATRLLSPDRFSDGLNDFLKETETASCVTLLQVRTRIKLSFLR